MLWKQLKKCFQKSVSLFKKAKSLELKSTVQRRHVARCAGLARLPLKKMLSGYKYIMQRSPKWAAVEKFCSYFINFWLNYIQFMKKLCCYKEDTRTTNQPTWRIACKAKQVYRTDNPSLAQVLQFLVKETKIRLRSKTVKSRNYKEIDTDSNWRSTQKYYNCWALFRNNFTV